MCVGDNTELEQLDIKGHEAIFAARVGKQAHTSALVSGLYECHRIVRYKRAARCHNEFACRRFAKPIAVFLLLQRVEFAAIISITCPSGS